MSTQEQLTALNVEITRANNYLRFIEERLTPQQRLDAQKLETEMRTARAARSAKLPRK
jgi:hypothetical protein